MTKDELRPLIEHGAAAFHLESALIYGIIMAESAAISAHNAGHPVAANHHYVARVKAHAKDYGCHCDSA